MTREYKGKVFIKRNNIRENDDFTDYPIKPYKVNSDSTNIINVITTINLGLGGFEP